MTPDECFNAMAEALGMENPKDVGYLVILQEVKKLREENNKLEEKFEKLKKKFVEIPDALNGGVLDLMVAKSKELMEENEKLKEYRTMVYNVWSDLYWADKAGSEVSFKDVSRSCDYYENEEFVKKEVVDDWNL